MGYLIGLAQNLQGELVTTSSHKPSAAMQPDSMFRNLRAGTPFTTGTGATITLTTLSAIYALSMVTSLPGLAVSPILDKLQSVFPHASQLEIQMLTSLPALLIIPFIIIAGKIALSFDLRKLIILGLWVFTASAIVYLLPIGINVMLANSILLGAGAGIVVPLSTGILAQYFTGQRRTRQLGIASAISNLSLVLATGLAGWLAGIEWRMSFLVYALAAVALILAYKIPQKIVTHPTTASAEPIAPQPQPQKLLFGRIKTDWPVGLMIFYFVITLVALSVPLNLSVYMQHYGIGDAAVSGTLISIFFLAITIPGFFITRLITDAKERNNLVWLGVILLGAILFMFSELWSVIAGVVLMGAGYGVMQPLVYDRTAEHSAPRRVTFHLALVMAMNYLAIVLYPFVQRLAEGLTGSDSMKLPFLLSLGLGAAYWIFDFIRVVKHRKRT